METFIPVQPFSCFSIGFIKNNIICFKASNLTFPILMTKDRYDKSVMANRILTLKEYDGIITNEKNKKT